MKQELLIPELSALGKAAEDFLRLTAGRRILAFHAPMGAGKTTFITALTRALGVREDSVSSPSFSIVNEYRGGGGEVIYHFDFYRISKLSEALDIGLNDYLDSGALCLIEWPENIAELLPEETLSVRISVRPDGARLLEWESFS